MLGMFLMFLGLHLKAFTHKSGHSESNRKLKMMTDDDLPHTVCTLVTLQIAALFICAHFAWYNHLNKFISSFSNCIKHTDAKTGPNWLNSILTFLIVQVLKVRKENKVTILELSSTFLPQANRNKLLQYILGFTLLWAKDLIPVLTPGSF